MRRISVESLVPGMVIVRCDRTGIRFPFYGRPIQHKGVIDILKVHGVRYVYIRKKSAVIPDSAALHGDDHFSAPPTDHDYNDIPDAAEPAPAYLDDIMEAARQSDVGRYRTTVEDIHQVRTIYDNAKNITKQMLIDARIGRTVDTSLAKDAVNGMVEQCLTRPNVFSTLTRLKSFDDYTFTHSINVGVLTIALGRRLGLDAGDLREIGLGSMLHDIGKMFVPADILNKPGRLDDREFDIIRTHPAMGGDLLKKGANVSSTVIECVTQHHERSDGTGYPTALVERDISRFGRITSIADVYDAITSTRCYRKGMIPPEAMKLIFSWSGKHFNEVLVNFFSDILGIFPVGTFVMLDTGEMGVVFDTTGDPTRPHVLVLTDAAGARTAPFVCDLTHYNLVTKKPYRTIISPLDPEPYGIDPARFIDDFVAAARLTSA